MGIQKSHTLRLTTVPCQARYSGASIDVALSPEQGDGRRLKNRSHSASPEDGSRKRQNLSCKHIETDICITEAYSVRCSVHRESWRDVLFD